MGELTFDKAKESYIFECQKVGLVPLHVTTMVYDKYSEKYTLSNSENGDFADLEPNGRVCAMHWNTTR
jgi:hypothetical protein